MAYRQLLTDLGRDIVADSQTGQVLRFTKLELGEGETAIDDVPEMLELVSPVMETGIASVVRDRPGQVTLTTKILIPSIPRAFELNEIGIFARVGDGQEMLYGVCVAVERAEFLSPGMAGSSTAEHTIAIAVVVGATQEVDAIFDPDVRIINIGPETFGAGLYSRRTGNTFEFKRVSAEGGLQITETAETVHFLVATQTPIGAMSPFAGSVTPSGWLLCDGASYSRTAYPGLAAILGSTYGGDASNFNVPDARGRTLIGAGLGTGLTNRALGGRGGTETHQLTVAELAAHGHGAGQDSHGHTVFDNGHTHPASPYPHYHEMNVTAVEQYASLSGAMPRWAMWGGISEGTVSHSGNTLLPNPTPAGPTGIYLSTIAPAISVYNAGSSAAHNNMQPYLAVSYIIKY